MPQLEEMNRVLQADLWLSVLGSTPSETSLFEVLDLPMVVPTDRLYRALDAAIQDALDQGLDLRHYSAEDLRYALLGAEDLRWR